MIDVSNMTTQEKLEQLLRLVCAGRMDAAKRLSEVLADLLDKPKKAK